LHVGSGTSVDVVDLPIMRERITGFPVIPSTSLKGVLLQQGRELWPSTWTTPEKPNEKPREVLHQNNRVLFGTTEEPELDANGNPVKDADGKPKKISYAGCVQIMEAKILAFPVRSLAGCFAWLTCPAVLERFKRDTGRQFSIPKVDKDRVVAGSELVIPDQTQVVLEEYALELQSDVEGKRRLDPEGADQALCVTLGNLVSDPFWSGKLSARLAIVHDENFQHFVTTCTEVVARIVINPSTRINENLFNQENVPCEALFYSVLHVLPPRKPDANGDLNQQLTYLLAEANVIQIGGDETTGHGLCETKHQSLNNGKEAK
jgi:CRISPR-associated protein Cmr4